MTSLYVTLVNLEFMEIKNVLLNKVYLVLVLVVTEIIIFTVVVRDVTIGLLLVCLIKCSMTIYGESICTFTECANHMSCHDNHSIYI